MSVYCFNQDHYEEFYSKGSHEILQGRRFLEKWAGRPFLVQIVRF